MGGGALLLAQPATVGVHIIILADNSYALLSASIIIRTPTVAGWARGSSAPPPPPLLVLLLLLLLIATVHVANSTTVLARQYYYNNNSAQ